MNNFKIRNKEAIKIGTQTLKTKIHNENKRVYTQANEAKEKEKEKPTKKIMLYSKAPISKITNNKTENEKAIKLTNNQKPNHTIAKISNYKPKTLKTQPSQRINSRIDHKRVDSFFNKKTQAKVSVLKKSTIIKQSKQPKQLKGAEKYALEEKVGSGTFGVVYKARNKLTLEVVAIKKVFQDRKYKNRQGQILKLLNHRNVLKMKDSFFTNEKQGEFLNVVMDYFPDTAYSIIRKHSKKNPIDPTLVKIYAYQLFRSLLYLNKISICHRDIKPHNILVDDSTNKLIMCDFGSAKQLVYGEPNIAYICSRCYRAPELIFGATNYTTQIDMWSAGCVIAEMLIFQPLFMATSNIDQLVEIIKSLGTPSQEEIMAMNPEYDMDQFRFPQIPARDWKKMIKGNQDPLLMDLLKQILRYNPEQRLTPFQALCHQYFSQFRNQRQYYRLKQQYEVPQLFNFNKSECSSSQLQALSPQWLKY